MRLSPENLKNLKTKSRYYCNYHFLLQPKQQQPEDLGSTRNEGEVEKISRHGSYTAVRFPFSVI